MYHLNHIAYIVLLVLIIVSPLFIWTIIGRPRIIKRKQWRTPPAADIRLARDWQGNTIELDEVEQSIS